MPAGKYGTQDGSGVTLDLPLNREGIANYIGVTRETVSRKLTALKDKGIIELIGNKKIRILNEEALENFI